MGQPAKEIPPGPHLGDGQEFENSLRRTVDNLNKILGPHFITKYGTKQGVLVPSKQVPRGIGAVLGAGGNFGFGWLTVASARRIFGLPPATWHSQTSVGTSVPMPLPQPAR